MNALRKSLLAVTAVFSLAPATVFAYPPQCDEVCTFEPSHCGVICYWGIFERTTCGEAGYCSAVSPTPVEPTASVMERESQQAEDAAPVCEDAHPADARNATSES